jgi:penicillin-binding protein 1A
MGDSAQASQFAAPIFGDFMAAALKDKPATPFRVPPGIKLVRVNVASGQRAGSGEGGGTILEAFKPGTGPPEGYVSYPGASASAAVNPDADRAVGAGTGGLY